MTDKELVWYTLENTKWNNGHTDINDLWKGFASDKEQKQQVRLILEEDGMATPNVHDWWSLMITLRGFNLKEEDLLENGRLPREKKIDWAYIKTLGAIMFGTLMGWLFSFFK
ncbi:MAG: hypothetical protein KAI99_02960 [Cyclobacteriaceae bacterium]|nr:hypothetical protein [Cyclobacteriaceae bacterium]